MKTILTTIAVALLLVCANITSQAQTINCNSFCVTQITTDSLNFGAVLVSIVMTDSGFINYPFILEIRDAGNNVVANGNMFFFGQFGGTTQNYPASSNQTNWSNFTGTIVFVYDNDTCYLPYPCTISSTQDIEEHGSYSLSPNPATDQIVLNTTRELNAATVEILTIDVKIVQTLNSVQGTRIEIATALLPNGIYFIRILEEEQFLKSERVIISR